jgi:transcriptional regulator GlxA family with amidase domain
MSRDAGSRAAAALHAARMIAESAGTAPVRAIAQRLGISTRSLERRFEQAVGLSPRTARRVARFQQAVHIALAENHASLAAIAVRSGYYDQAHFTRDFTALSGLSPAAWRAERAVATVQDTARQPV